MRGLSEQEVFLGPGSSHTVNGTVAGDNPGTVPPSSQEVISRSIHTTHSSCSQKKPARQECGFGTRGLHSLAGLGN